MTRPRIVIEGWDPQYGSSVGDVASEPSAADVNLNVEIPPERWRPLPPNQSLERARRVVFVDGVRRIEALCWVNEPDGSTKRGICASFAAGIVEAERRAVVTSAEVRRGLFTSADVDSLHTRAGEFTQFTVAADELDNLTLSLQQRLGELEIQVATSLDSVSDLVVVDGPLSGRQNVPGAVGYVKTHRVAYLPESLSRVIGALAAGERTPIFVSTTSWTRFSWYLRLPGPIGHPWAGIVRVEASGDLPVARAKALADCTAVTLPHYASVPHKDPRAPQNLFPVSGLERQLRRRLGDAFFVQRALKAATAHS